jgi:hypothetical protein
MMKKVKKNRKENSKRKFCGTGTRFPLPARIRLQLNLSREAGRISQQEREGNIAKGWSHQEGSE